jgi:hypothetical protein
MKPKARNPKIIMAQVEGSGTPATIAEDALTYSEEPGLNGARRAGSAQRAPI